MTDKALKYGVLNFSFDVEGGEGKRNYSVDVYRISKKAIKVRYEADEDWNITVFQTLKTGEEVPVEFTSQDSFNDGKYLCDLKRLELKTKIFKNCTNGIAALFGIGIGIATAATAATGPAIAAANVPAIAASTPEESEEMDLE